MRAAHADHANSWLSEYFKNQTQTQGNVARPIAYSGVTGIGAYSLDQLKEVEKTPEILSHVIKVDGVKWSYHHDNLLAKIKGIYGESTKLTPPIPPLGGPLVVSVGIFMYALSDVDVISDTFQLEYFLRLSWRDWRLKWDPDDYGGIRRIAVEKDSIWTPQVLPMNNGAESSETLTNFYDETHLTITHPPKFKGEYYNVSEHTDQPVVYWSRVGNTRFRCRPDDTTLMTTAGGEFHLPIDENILRKVGGKRRWPSNLDLSLFPFDFQHCQMVFGTWTSTADKIKFDMMSPAAEPSVPNRAHNQGVASPSPQWHVLEVFGEVVDAVYEVFPTAHWSQVNFYLTFERESADYLLNIILPVVVITYLGLLSFFIPIEAGERIGLGMTALLTVLAVMFITMDQLPKTKDVTLLTVFYLISISYCVIPVVVSAINLYMVKCDSRTISNSVRIREVLDVLEEGAEMVPDVDGLGGKKHKHHAKSLRIPLYGHGPKAIVRRARHEFACILWRIYIGFFQVIRVLPHMENIQDLAPPTWRDIVEMVDETVCVISFVGYSSFLFVLHIAQIEARKDYRFHVMQTTLTNALFAICVILVRYALHVRYTNFIATVFRDGDSEEYKVTDEQLDEYRDQFLLFDRNRNGYITFAELMLSYNKLGRHSESATESLYLAISAIKNVDVDMDAKISFAEFVSVLERSKASVKLRRDMRKAGVYDSVFTGDDQQRKRVHELLTNIGVETWDVDDVARWMTAHSFEQAVVLKFKEQGIDGKIFVTLTDSEIRKDLGMEKLSERRRFRAEVAALLQKGMASRFRSAAARAASQLTTSRDKPEQLPPLVQISAEEEEGNGEEAVESRVQIVDTKLYRVHPERME